MADSPRRDIFDPDEVGTYHCWNRCVRRAFLCGDDAATGKNFDHRRQWVEERDQLLARLFAIDVSFHAAMSNHIHLVLRNRPDIAERWSDVEVVRRWLTITKLTRNFEDVIVPPDDKRVERLARDPDYVADVRKRLSNISYFMAALCENIARRSNHEDGVSGKFWEERFKCRKCVDEAAILICGIYVDLNQIRAAEVSTPEESDHTSVGNRINAHFETSRSSANSDDISEMPADGWLSPLTLEEGPEADVWPGQGSTTPWRASDKGVLPISFEEYLELLDCTGRELKADKPGAIPGHLANILVRLGIRPDTWIETIADGHRKFKRAIGKLCNLKETAEKAGRKWLQGVGHCQHVFS